MPTKREQLEQELVQQAHKAIQKLLDELPEASEITLSDMEKATGNRGQAIRQQTLQSLVEMKQQPLASEVMGESGKKGRSRRGKRHKRLVTLRGEVEVERQYYVCPSCGTGRLPPDEQWGLNATVYSREVARQRVWLSGLLPYAQCEQVFERIGERFMPASRLWRQTQRHGAHLQTYVEQQREQVGVERVVLPAALQDPDQRKAVSMDGGRVNIRGEGWREWKVGTVFDVETRLERNPHTQELDDLAHGVKVHSTAILGSAKNFTPALWALAVEHDLPTAKERAVVGDGALWIWNVAEDVCPDGRQIVDWFHATQHLSEAAHALYPDDTRRPKRSAWLKTYQDHLYMGRVHNIIAVLKKRQRDDLASYFERHQRRMP